MRIVFACFAATAVRDANQAKHAKTIRIGYAIGTPAKK